ncbi:MAG: FKBP-type peptidyl-prolyl cis-trans isomerase [Nitrososphaerota archaeon]|nr:peptidylprolyl isomerase [Candidatus Bathyarchaeota archaeon]MCX8162166.1 peptidylprolyl isomerase [Candidatus Bathyarchaeota archaeon]MDW8061445.1 FKBP-type peptidyl-prolyl cis-trans isomerase [Nitrososphaerota archaeon]
MPIEKGSFILVDYTVTVKETGEPVETTMEEDAKQLGIYRAGEVYEPRLVVVGEGWVFKGVEEALPNLKLGEPIVVEVPPDKGVGPRDPSKIRMMPLRRFPRDSRPRIGDRVEVDGRVGIVRAIGAGRVQVDFNHPLAGKTLVYKMILRKILESIEERVGYLLKRRLPGIDISRTIVRITDRRVEVELPSDLQLAEGIQLAKRGFAMDVARYIEGIDEVVFVERYKAEARRMESSS